MRQFYFRCAVDFIKIWAEFPLFLYKPGDTSRLQFSQKSISNTSRHFVYPQFQIKRDLYISTLLYENYTYLYKDTTIYIHYSPTNLVRYRYYKSRILYPIPIVRLNIVTGYYYSVRSRVKTISFESIYL